MTNRMLRMVKSRAKSLLWHFPIIGNYLVGRKIQEQFSNEMQLISGKHCNESNKRSIIHFSVNKAATQYVKGILRRCATENGMTHIRLADYAFDTGFPYLDHLSVGEMEKYQYLFKPRGYLYSVFGGMIEGIPNFDKYLTILLVRDPRDILVSDYFSMRHSHPEPLKQGNKYDGFMEVRKKARQITIDEYVKTESDMVNSNFQRYIHVLVNQHQHIYITKYEEMISEFRIWLEGLLDYCELEITNELMQALLAESKYLRPIKEDVYQHIRKGRSGDYKDKLKPETIDYLNSKFLHILEKFNYL